MSESETNTSPRSWFTISNIVIAVAMIFLLSLTIWNESIAEALFIEEASLPQLTAEPTDLQAAETAIPEEFYGDPASSSGIIMGVVFILIVVFGSAIWKLLSERE